MANQVAADNRDIFALEQGKARLDQADHDRPDRETKTDPGPGRGFTEGVLQGARAARQQRVIPAGESRKKGFDTSLPAEGLLIWRVVGNRPILEESHGVEGPAGPRMFLDKVPYPTVCNDAFTPFTMPSSRSQLGGGLPVYITNITKLADGRISFQIGYEYY